MRIIILTCSEQGTSSHHLQHLVKSDKIEIAMVVISQNLTSTKKKIRRIVKKTKKIGIAGALNGIRMRKWFSDDLNKYIHFNTISDLCTKYNIPLCHVPSINSHETKKIFDEANSDLGISLGNGYISERIFTIPKNGMINIHHEQLPQFQNAQSIIWQLYNNSTHTGYTIHKIDKHIDTGNILSMENIPITFRDTLADTVTYNLARLYEHSAIGLVNVIENFDAFNKNSITQKEGKIYTTPTIKEFWEIKKRFKILKSSSFL